jgi:hypothetical protein
LADLTNFEKFYIEKLIVMLNLPLLYTKKFKVSFFSPHSILSHIFIPSRLLHNKLFLIPQIPLTLNITIYESKQTIFISLIKNDKLQRLITTGFYAKNANRKSPVILQRTVQVFLTEIQQFIPNNFFSVNFINVNKTKINLIQNLISTNQLQIKTYQYINKEPFNGVTIKKKRK